jgi:hypothetical protein
VDSETSCPACEKSQFASQRRVKKFAEGLSIRAAESIRSIYGYTRLAVTTEPLEDGRAKITGTLVDYAAGNLTSDERIVSPFYKSRQGQIVRMPEDRFLDVKVKAEKSKLRRDVILDSVPNIVKACFRDACEKKLQELVSPELIEQKIIPAFAQYGLSAEHLERIIGRPYKLGWRESERMELRKILTALQNGETTAHELLGDLDAPAPKKENGKGATMADLTGEKKEQLKEEEKVDKKPACAHPAITPAKLNRVAKGHSLSCPDCGEMFPSPKDDVVAPDALPFDKPAEKSEPKASQANEKPMPPTDPLASLFSEVHRRTGKNVTKLKEMWSAVEEAFDKTGGNIDEARVVPEKFK